MKRLTTLLLLLGITFTAYGQEFANCQPCEDEIPIIGPTQVTQGSTVTYSLNGTAQCPSCHYWTVTGAGATYVTSRTGSSVDVEFTGTGSFQVCLVYFRDGVCYSCCIGGECTPDCDCEPDIYGTLICKDCKVDHAEVWIVLNDECPPVDSIYWEFNGFTFPGGPLGGQSSGWTYGNTVPGSGGVDAGDYSCANDLPLEVRALIYYEGCTEPVEVIEFIWPTHRTPCEGFEGESSGGSSSGATEEDDNSDMPTLNTKVYPNPIPQSESFIVELSTQGQGAFKEENLTLAIVDVSTGQELLRKEITYNGRYHTEMVESLDNATNNLMVVVYKGNTALSSEKFMVE